MDDKGGLMERYGKYLTQGEEPVREFKAGFYRAVATDKRVIFIRAFPKAFIPVPYKSINNIEHQVYLVWDVLVKAVVFLTVSAYGYLQYSSFMGFIGGILSFIESKIPEFSGLTSALSAGTLADIMLLLLPIAGVYYLFKFIFSLSGRLKISLKGSPSIRISTPLTRDVRDIIKFVEMSIEGKTIKAEAGLKNLASGYTYLVKEYHPEKSQKLFLQEVNMGCKGLYLSRTNPEQVRKDLEDDAEFGLVEDQIRMYWLTDSLTNEGSISPDLDQLFAFISDFIEKNPKSVVLLDGLEYLIGHSNFEQVLCFIEGIKDKIGLSNSRFIVPISPQALGEKEEARLEREVREVL